MKNKNKIILSALISSLFVLNASAAIITPNPGGGSFPMFPAYAPEEITDVSQRLTYNLVKTKIRFKSQYSDSKYVVVKLNYKYWDENDNKIKPAEEWLAGMYLDGRFKEITLPRNATQVNIKITGLKDIPYPGMKEMRLCSYNNPMTLVTQNTQDMTNLVEIGFFKNGLGELEAKIGLAETSSLFYYNQALQYNGCKPFPITGSTAEPETGTGDEPVVQPGNNGWEEPG